MFPAHVSSKNYNKKVGHHACLGDMTSQFYLIYACTEHYFTGSQYILWQLKGGIFKVTIKKN